MSDWLDSVSAETPPADDAPAQLPETTGMLAGVATFLPSEKVVIPSTVTQKSWGGLDVAARQFHTIATTPPRPATLPLLSSRHEELASRAIRAGLYLLFILLVALPLLPGLQNVVNEETGQRAPWTEPAREFSDVLDSQRRQLISEQLGIIDLQPPGSVALVSFDYTPATQGEMQPLAEAVTGRLKGQGMRIIGVSLQPEGPAMAQQTFDTILAERDEIYGAELVNLGYLPGDAAAVRQLATNPQALVNIPDYQEQLTFQHPNRQNWADVQNLGQVDVVITLADNPATARWWVEQLELAPPAAGRERYLLAAASASAEPFLIPYRDSEQLDGLLTGISGAAAIEAGRRSFGPARQMIDSQSVAHLLLVILIAVGTIVGWMPHEAPQQKSVEPE